MECDNMQKYENYREQMGRLNKALNACFYLEAIFIEYAVMEDRLESILVHAGKWNPKPDTFVSMDTKCKKVAKLAENKKDLAHRYFSPELTDSLLQWKEKRNSLIHAMLKQTVSTEELRVVAEEGKQIAKTLCSKATSYRRALKKEESN